MRGQWSVILFCCTLLVIIREFAVWLSLVEDSGVFPKVLAIFEGELRGHFAPKEDIGFAHVDVGVELVMVVVGVPETRDLAGFRQLLGPQVLR